jgi:hypothetical protein
MPRSPDADRELADARAALAAGALTHAGESAWRAAAAAASIGDEQALEDVLALAGTLVEQTTGGDRDEAERLRLYAEACLEDAQRGTRRPSAFERLMGWTQRPAK